MFGKKLLSLVSLLFAGSQLKSVLAECTVNYDATNGCVLGAGSSCALNEQGYYVVDDGKGGAKLLCKVTDATSINKVEDEVGYFKIVSGGYATRKSNNDIGSIADGSITDCTGGEGFLGPDFKLCIDVDKNNALQYDENGQNNYLITIKNGATNIFDSTDDKKVVVKADANSFTLDSNFKDGNDYCVDSNKVIRTRKEDLCNGSECNYYTKDKDGWKATTTNVQRVEDPNCDPTNCSDSNCTCKTGYHYSSKGTGSHLYKCEEGKGCGSVLADENVPFGYVVAHDKSYIVCEANGVCKPYTLESDCGDTAQSGTLFGTNADDAQLCIVPSNSSPVTAPVGTDGKFMVPYQASLIGIGAINDDGYFITMEIKEKSVTILKETIRYRYTDTDDTNTKSLYKVFSRTEAFNTKSTAGAICNATGKPFEYMLVQWTVAGVSFNGKVDYYVAGDNSDLPTE